VIHKWLQIVIVILFSIFYNGDHSYASSVKMVIVEGVINPITERFVVNAIDEAEKEHAECIIIKMDTPGGLASATHNIVKKILNAKVPVVTFIAPKGARAASAGVFIALASDIIAMAPMTHIGAAHPVAIGGAKQDKAITDKITNDLVASVKSIAKKKGRNAEWAESAVRESASITEEEALRLKVIDLISEDVKDLLKKLDKKVVKKHKKEFTLHTKDVVPEIIRMNFRERFLHAIADPNVAYVLLMLGIYGLIYEFASPGVGIGAVGGGICLILAFFGLQNLPINMAGLLLIILGIILLILEVLTASHGILAIGGLTSLAIGSFMLIDSPTPFMTISWKLIISVVVFTGLFFIFGIGAAIAAHRKKVTTGRESVIGTIGVVKKKLDPEGIVFLQGENWSAYTTEGVIEEGEKVKVIDMDRMKLIVKPCDNNTKNVDNNSKE
jgi:membrane-bound serine protease (ClpP class)